MNTDQIRAPPGLPDVKRVGTAVVHVIIRFPQFNVVIYRGHRGQRQKLLRLLHYFYPPHLKQISLSTSIGKVGTTPRVTLKPELTGTYDYLGTGVEDMSHSGIERPSAPESDRPAKRQRTKDHKYRTRSPPPKREYDHWEPENSRDRNSHVSNHNRPPPRYRSDRDRSMSPNRKPSGKPQPRTNNKKTSKERKQNPSTQIRSIRNLLERGNLPATVQQEKERELAALLFDQQKQTIKRDGKKNLSRYHFVRFVERQKATRAVKKLKKLQEQRGLSEEEKKQLHHVEVDMNYTIYAPLAQKYISIYPKEDGADGMTRPVVKNHSRMHKEDYDALSAEQQYEIEQVSIDAANTLSLVGGSSGVRPPMWYVVEEKMKEGEKALEALRNQQEQVDTSVSLVLGSKTKSVPSWLTDDGKIDPADLDSDSDQEDGGAGLNRNDDDEMSDGDGGFFERR